MTVDSPPRATAVVESAGHHGGEALFEEARRHARRRRLAYGAAAVAVAAVAAFGAVAAIQDAAPSPGRPSSVGAPAATSPLGVFEPLRGWIVYPVAHELKAIDPEGRSAPYTLTLPEPMVAALGPGANVVPAGWSARGTELALTSEYTGATYVMDASGAITRIGGAGGCCWFVTDNWLSPDGTTVIDGFDGGHGLRLRNLVDADASRVIELDPPVGGPSTMESGVIATTAWSPDGAQIAYTSFRRVGRTFLPSVHVVDLGTGSTRPLAHPQFGHIRQMSWSPDGRHLLVIAGPWHQSTSRPSGNPLVAPQETGLYLLGTDGSTPASAASPPDEIAAGYYVAAAWSPDGEQIAVIDYGPSGRRLVVMDADGSASRDLAGLPRSELFTGLAWHPMPLRR